MKSFFKYVLEYFAVEKEPPLEDYYERVSTLPNKENLTELLSELKFQEKHFFNISIEAYQRVKNVRNHKEEIANILHIIEIEEKK